MKALYRGSLVAACYIAAMLLYGAKVSHFRTQDDAAKLAVLIAVGLMAALVAIATRPAQP